MGEFVSKANPSLRKFRKDGNTNTSPTPVSSSIAPPLSVAETTLSQPAVGTPAPTPMQIANRPQEFRIWDRFIDLLERKGWREEFIANLFILEPEERDRVVKKMTDALSPAYLIEGVFTPPSLVVENTLQALAKFGDLALAEIPALPALAEGNPQVLFCKFATARDTFVFYHKWLQKMGVPFHEKNFQLNDFFAEEDVSEPDLCNWVRLNMEGMEGAPSVTEKMVAEDKVLAGLEVLAFCCQHPHYVLQKKPKFYLQGIEDGNGNILSIRVNTDKDTKMDWLVLEPVPRDLEKKGFKSLLVT